MYQVLYMIDHEFPGKRGGFVHVPFTPEQVVDKPGQPALSTSDVTAALAEALRAIVEYHGKPDEKNADGALH